MRYLAESVPRLNTQQMIKEENSKLLFRLIARQPGVTRARLGRITALSPTTVSTLVDELVRQDLVQETGQAITQNAGRKPISLRVKADGRQIAVFSLNRWGIRYTLFNLALKVIETAFLAYAADRFGGFAEGVANPNPDAGDEYAALLENILEKSPAYNPESALAVCISFPGIYVEREKRFTWSAMHVSFAKASLEALEERLGIPVFLGNSSMSMAYAEKHLEGMDERAGDLIYVYVFDGLGAGIIADGVFLTGSDHSAGEIGHISVDYKGKRCTCGGRGCVEQYVNVDAILGRVRAAVNEKPCTELFDMLGDSLDNLTLETVGRAYDMGLPAVCEALDEVAAMLFQAIYATVCITGIKRVIIGGGIERLGKGFLERLIAFTKHHQASPFMRAIAFSYAKSGFNGDSEGIAQFYLDHVFALTAAPEARAAIL